VTLRSTLRVCAIAACVAAARPSTAADTWTEARSPNFTVVSNAGAKTARNIAWQYEQIRAAIAKGFPWAQVQLDRPVVVIAVKDESSMKALAPEYWESNRLRPGSVFVTAPDRHLVAVRADIRGEDNDGMNPYKQAFWSYAVLAIENGFRHQLPEWYVTGLASVLSNSIVRADAIQFGRPIPGYVRTIVNEPRFPLERILLGETPPHAQMSPIERNRYDAECWGLVQFLLFGENDARIDRVNELSKLIVGGMRAPEAVAQVYGSVAKVESDYLVYVKRGLFHYVRLSVESDVAAERYPIRVLTTAEEAAERAAFQVAMNRPNEARQLVAEARADNPELSRSWEVEALLLDREEKTAEARSAFQKAKDADSKNFWTYYRLATIDWPTTDPARLAASQPLLQTATTLNDRFGPAFSAEAALLLLRNQPGQALQPAMRAADIEPGSFANWAALTGILVRLSKTADAQIAARTAMEVARTEQEKTLARSLAESAAAAQRPPDPAPNSSGAPSADGKGPGSSARQGSGRRCSSRATTSPTRGS